VISPVLVAHEQNIVATLTGVDILIELVGVLTRRKDDVSSCDKKKLARLARIRNKETSCPFNSNRWGSLSRNRETEGSGEKHESICSRIKSGSRFVEFRSLHDSGLPDFNMDVI